MDLPEWMRPHEELWNDFLAHREMKKKPLTELAQKMAIRKLERYSKEGCKVEEMLETAIFSNWDGIWPVYTYAKKPEQVSKPASHKLYEPKPYVKGSDEAREKAMAEVRAQMHIVKRS